MVGVNIGFQCLDTLYAAAVRAGDDTLADMIAKTITELKSAQVFWNGSAWKLVFPGRAKADASSVSAKVEA
jgi:hypothetical protein